jgi:dCMP deaminase
MYTREEIKNKFNVVDEFINEHFYFASFNSFGTILFFSNLVDNFFKELNWHKFYIEVANKFASMSKDPRLQVGCVIVTQNGILYPGINGLEKGGSNEVDSLEPGCSGCVHSEANALIRFNPSLHKECKLYISHFPCRICCRMIVNTQAISEVYYEKEYRDLSGIEILQKAGIKVKKINLL